MSQSNRVFRSTQLLLEFEVKNSPRATAAVSTSCRKDPESPIKNFLDYFGPDTEQSVLIDLDLQKLKKKYSIPEEF